MGHISAEFDWANIDINAQTHNIFVQQRWKYSFQPWPGSQHPKTGRIEWTHPEKVAYHNKLDRKIWSHWSNKVFYIVTGTSEFANSQQGKEFSRTFDVKWVTTNPHWQVFVNKVPKGCYPNAAVTWKDRLIYLDSESLDLDLTSSYRCGDTKVSVSPQLAVAHEFGHAIGYRSDEYDCSSRFFSDTQALMHVGMELCTRYFSHVTSCLNRMIPNTQFLIARGP